MRTKTLVLSAALCAASIAAAVAQTGPVYSVNAVGYVNVTVPAGKFVCLANPLNQPTNSLAAVLPDVPNNSSVVYKFDPVTGFAQLTKRSTGWTGTGAATAMLNPGEAFFFKNNATADVNITFVGEVPTGTNTVNFIAGYNAVASMVPQEGLVQTDLGLPAKNSDKVWQFDTTSQSYIQYTRRTSSWTPSEPKAKVAEGFFFQTTTPGAWTRVFNINQ